MRGEIRRDTSMVRHLRLISLMYRASETIETANTVREAWKCMGWSCEDTHTHTDMHGPYNSGYEFEKDERNGRDLGKGAARKTEDCLRHEPKLVYLLRIGGLHV